LTADLLEAIEDPNHERHAELKYWIEADFDPKTVDTDRLADALTVLAKRWSRKLAPDGCARPDPRCSAEGYGAIEDIAGAPCLAQNLCHT
jgi:hypothetical protein